MNTEADAVFRGLCDAIVGLNETLAPAESASDWDQFTLVFGAGDGAVEQIARDRTTAVIPTKGPVRGRTGCTETLTFAVAIIYLDKRESSERMLRDMPPLRHRLRTLQGHIAGVKLSNVDGPYYDYKTLPEACVVSWVVDIEYHVDPTAGG